MKFQLKRIDRTIQIKTPTMTHNLNRDEAQKLAQQLRSLIDDMDREEIDKTTGFLQGWLHGFNK